jgi:hypothetical protein
MHKVGRESAEIEREREVTAVEKRSEQFDWEVLRDRRVGRVAWEEL